MAACESLENFADAQRAATNPPIDPNLPVWAKGNLIPFSKPTADETAIASPGDVILETGFTLRNGGLIALGGLQIFDGDIEYDIVQNTYFPPDPTKTRGVTPTYCYRDICLQIVNERVQFPDGRLTDIDPKSFLIVPPAGRLLAVGLSRELTYLGFEGDKLLFRFRELYNGEERHRRELEAPAQPGATFQHLGALIDILDVSRGTLTYRVVTPFRS